MHRLGSFISIFRIPVRKELGILATRVSRRSANRKATACASSSLEMQGIGQYQPLPVPTRRSWERAGFRVGYKKSVIKQYASLGACAAGRSTAVD